MKKVKIIFKILIISVLVIFLNGIYYVFSGQFKSVNKIKHGEELNIYECCSIYTMHIAVWMFGWPISPEAAYEAFLMHFPHDNIVERNIDMYAANGYSTEMSVKSKDYASLKGDKLRYALALNSPDTHFEVTENYSMCTVSIKYTDAVTRIGNIPMNTILFKYLQDRKILHPYTMVYYYMYV